MNKDEQHLSQLSTAWSIVRQAHHGLDEEKGAARGQLWQQYGSAVFRYLVKALRDTDAANDLYQDFALRFVRGDFHRADPERGRFRDFVKTALFHLIVDYRKRQRRNPRPLGDDPEPAVLDEPGLETDAAYLASWRETLLSRTWELLLGQEQATGRPYYKVLRFRFDNPDMPSPDMVAPLSGLLGKRLSAVNVRQLLHQARKAFEDLLLDEVAQSLAVPSRDELEAELVELGLFEYCRPALERRFD